jgi:hypothetical protein
LCYWRRFELMVPVVVVTVTFTPTEPPWLSLTTIVQVPAATAVTVNVPLGPVFEAGANVAIPAHDGLPLAAVNGPV